MKHRRKPSPLAVITGLTCLLISIGIIGGGFISIVILTRRSFPIAGQVLLFVGSLPLLMLILWLALKLMSVVEGTTGIEFRTRSTRPSSRRDSDSN